MLEKETKGLAKKYDSNPFVFKLQGRMYLQPRADTIIAKGQSIVDMTTGEIINEGIVIGKRKIVDKSQFAKIYASEIKTLYELSRTAMNIFLYLTRAMDYENKAYFSYVKDLEKIGYKSKGTAYKAIKELVDANIIAPSSMVNFWWLNPAIVCKGERFAKYTEYVVAKDGAHPSDIGKGEMAKQSERNRLSLPPEIQEKHERASLQRSLFDSENNDIGRE